MTATGGAGLDPAGDAGLAPAARGRFDASACAALLLEHRRSLEPFPDLPAGLLPPSLDAAYDVQRGVVAGLLVDGAAPVGFKVACTSQIAQQALRIDRPLFGRLLPGSSTTAPARLDADRFVHRVIEAEFAFRIGDDVPAAGETWEPRTIAGYIDAVIPAIEIVDYRYHSWTVGAHQVAADNAIHGAWVSGEPIDAEAVDLLGLDSVGVFVRRNGELVTTGSGAAVLGHPLRVMAWLADELPRFGLALRVGDLVTTGVTTDVFEAAAGDTIEAEFAGLGRVTVSFD